MTPTLRDALNELEHAHDKHQALEAVRPRTISEVLERCNWSLLLEMATDRVVQVWKEEKRAER